LNRCLQAPSAPPAPISLPWSFCPWAGFVLQLRLPRCVCASSPGSASWMRLGCVRWLCLQPHLLRLLTGPALSLDPVYPFALPGAVMCQHPALPVLFAFCEIASRCGGGLSVLWPPRLLVCVLLRAALFLLRLFAGRWWAQPATGSWHAAARAGSAVVCLLISPALHRSAAEANGSQLHPEQDCAICASHGATQLLEVPGCARLRGVPACFLTSLSGSYLLPVYGGH